jgi:Putative Ig domain
MIVSPPNSPMVGSRRGFALVVTLVMVALLAIIAIGLLSSVSVERATATSYTNRYQAELAAQNGLQAAAKTLAATPTGTNSITGTDTFLVVRADGPADGNGNKPAYYYLANPSRPPAPPSITYYPLFSSSTDPQTMAINLTAQDAPNPQDPTKPFAPLVPAPSPPPDSTPPPSPSPNSSPTPSGSAWNAAGNQRLPTLYPWQQPAPSPTPSPSGPSVQWVEMHNPQDASGPYTRYAYWAEDLGGYLDASQVGGQARASGSSPQEIAMWTVFNPTPQTDPGTAATTLINDRPLLFTVPTLRQLAAQASPSPSPSPDTGAYLAVRLGVDNSPGEQNLVPFGYGYGSAGAAKTNLNPLSQLHGNIPAKFATPLSAAMPNFVNRTAVTSGGKGNLGTVNYVNNLAANIIDYASPQNAPTDFMPNGNQNPPSARGVGAYPFVVSLYDLNNWVYAYQPSPTSTWHVVIEVKNYVQVWNPHNLPLSGALTIHYQNSDQVTVNGNLDTLNPPPDATIIFRDTDTDPQNPDPNQPVITSPLAEIGNVGVVFNYQITATNGANQYRRIKPNEYRVIVLPAPGSAPLDITGYGASGLPPGLTLKKNGQGAGVISGTPPAGSAGTYNVSISATNSSGTATATLVITINP